jgi:hypothetical protein
VFRLVASDPTVSRTINTLAKDAPAVLTAINRGGRRPGPGCGSQPASTLARRDRCHCSRW